MRTGAVVLCAAIGVALAPTAAQARVAFVGLEGLGLERSEVRPIERLLERALADLVGNDLMSPDQVMAALLDPGLARLQECQGQVHCLVDLGGILEADLVVYGTLSKLGETFGVVLRLVDVSVGAEKSRVDVQLSGTQDQLVDLGRSAAGQLLDPEQFRGALVIDDLLPVATVTIDGEPAEVVPGQPYRITVGPHVVTVEAPGYETESRMITVTLDEITRVSVTNRFVGAGGEQLPRWWPYVAMGVGGAALLTSGGLAYATLDQQWTVERAFRQHTLDSAGMASAVQSGQDLALWTNVTLGVGLGVAAVGLAGWIFQGEEGEPPGALTGFWRSWRRPILLGLGAAALGTSVALGGLTLAEEDTYGAEFREGDHDATVLRDSYERGRSYALATNVLLGVGTVLIVTAVLDWLILDFDSDFLF